MKKSIKFLTLLSSFLLPFSISGVILASEQTESAAVLQQKQKLQALQQENKNLEALQQELKEEEKRKAELTGQTVAQEPQQQQPASSAPPSDESEKSKWVQGRDKVEKEVGRIGKQVEDKVKKLF